MVSLKTPLSLVTQKDPEDILERLSLRKIKEIVLNNYDSGFHCHCHLNHISLEGLWYTRRIAQFLNSLPR